MSQFRAVLFIAFLRWLMMLNVEFKGGPDAVFTIHGGRYVAIVAKRGRERRYCGYLGRLSSDSFNRQSVATE